MYGDKTQSNDFYRGEPLVSKLTAALWPRRVTGDAIWLVEFYAPWCSACGSFVPIFKKIAQALEHDAVEVPCPLPPPRAPRPSPHAPLPAAAPVSPSGGAAPALQRPGVCGRVRVGR
jgi:thiol-disulfide isomerase/thioredoxin